MDSASVFRNPERLRALWPDIRDLPRPYRGRLLLGMALLALHRATGLVLPGSTKYLVDDVIGKKQMDLLVPLAALVAAASVLQGATGALELTPQRRSPVWEAIWDYPQNVSPGARRAFTTSGFSSTPSPGLSVTRTNPP
ncbi:MAG: hypothetical protein LAQ30_25620 [Acidobacteriia bacterium]|nr:hypothetical protein [Terriglobia bacterium]